MKSISLSRLLFKVFGRSVAITVIILLVVVIGNLLWVMFSNHSVSVNAGQVAWQILAFDLFSHASFSGIAGSHLEGPAIFVIPVLVATISCSFASLFWVSKDAENRNKSSFLVVLFILLTGWPWSFVWWFWLRPPLKINQ